MSSNRSVSPAEIRRYDVAAAVDALSVSVGPASILVAHETRPVILAVGRPSDVDRHPAAAGASRESLPDAVLIPPLVNAHTHLDLSHIGPRDAANGFTDFAELVRAERRSAPAEIAAAVRQGIAMSIRGGVAAVGDIAGAPRTGPSLVPWQTLRESPLLGTSYLEFFAIGAMEAESRRRVEGVLERVPAGGEGVQFGLQPHAPYSVSFESYQWVCGVAARRSLGLSTHLAETAEEREFIARGSGPLRSFLERIGVWTDAIANSIGRGRHPVEHLARVIAERPFVLAHLNDLSDAAIEVLAGAGSSVAYCPRASAYFGAERALGPHRYRDLIRAGVNVALGTDSVINLPEADVAVRGMSILDEMRVLQARDGVEARQLLLMGTLAGARALGLDPSLFSLAPDSRPLGLLAIQAPGTGDPLARAIASDQPIRWLFGAGVAPHS